MKRILIVFLMIISLNSFAQLQVKEGSFKHILNDKIDETYLDGNEMPMALIKISTENFSEQEQLRLVFSGNRETQIIKVPTTGQMWIYISAEAATFINIKHPDYGTYKYTLPEKLCDYCVYEMVVQNMQQLKFGYIVISSKPSEADIYIDGIHYGKTDNVILDGLTVGFHELKLKKEDYIDFVKTINIKENETLEIEEYLEKKLYSEQNQAHEYVDLGLSVKWATCNIGAKTPEEYGDYFVWGNINAMEDDGPYLKPNYPWFESAEGNPKFDIAAAKMGGKWRMPTESEMFELENYCKWEWTTQNGIGGYLVTSKKNSNSIFLPAAGYASDKRKYNVGTEGYYWSISYSSDNSAHRLYFNEDCVNCDVFSCCSTYLYLSVRPVRE